MLVFRKKVQKFPTKTPTRPFVTIPMELLDDSQGRHDLNIRNNQIVGRLAIFCNWNKKHLCEQCSEEMHVKNFNYEKHIGHSS